MLWFLRALFAGIFVIMSVTIAWASWQQPIFGIPSEVLGNPWFKATLADAYFAFLTFYIWLAWKEPTTGARVLWLLTVLLWGNFAMSIYVLRELFRIDRSDRLREVIVTQRAGHLALPLCFVLIGLAAYALGAGPLWR
jgi:hypothetical protein